MSKISIDHFSDTLCIWAYVAQIRVDELQEQLGNRIEIAYRFTDVFGSTEQKIGKGWEKRGGFEGYADHVAEVAAGFPHVELHADAWRGCRPRSSGTSHLFLKAAQRVSQQAEELARRIRLAFFRDARDIGELGVLREIAAELDIDPASIDLALADGTAMAALSEDAKLGDRFRVEGSPTYVLNEGRQKLYGNVGYKVIEANVLELIEVPEGRASWC